MDPVTPRVVSRFKRAALTPAQRKALDAIGGKIVTQGAWRAGGRGGQVGYGTVKTPSGSVDISEAVIKGLERLGLVKRIHHDVSITTEPAFEGRAASRSPRGLRRGK